MNIKEIEIVETSQNIYDNFNGFILSKDIKVFVRDPEQWSQLFILLALVCVYVFNIMYHP